MLAKRKLCLIAVVAVGLGMAWSSASGAPLNLGEAGGYAAFILPGGSINLTVNGGSSVVGDIGVTAGSHLDLGSGSKVGPLAGTDQVVLGTIFLDTISDPSKPATVKLDNQDPSTVGPPRDLTQAIQDAINANAFYAGLAPTQTFTDLDVTGPFTITGNGGLNVIDITGDIKLHGDGQLLLDGGPNDTFIFNIDGTFTQSSKSDVLLSPGGSPFMVLWNFIGTGNGANLGASGHTNLGIFLSPFRDFSVTDETITGGIISAGHLAIGSKSLVIVPEIPTTSALLIGFASLAGMLRLRRRARS